MDKPTTITIQIAMDYIVWMLYHPEELGEDEKLWIDKFKQLWKEHLEKDST